MNNEDKREHSMAFQIFIRSSLIKLFSQQALGGKYTVFGTVDVWRKFGIVSRNEFEMNSRFLIVKVKKHN